MVEKHLEYLCICSYGGTKFWGTGAMLVKVTDSAANVEVLIA
jgi:hypothetical protein